MSEEPGTHLRAAIAELERQKREINEALVVLEEIRDTWFAQPNKPQADKNPDAVALGRRGGKRGGPARAAAMSPEERSAAARKAAEARWGAA